MPSTGTSLSAVPTHTVYTAPGLDVARRLRFVEAGQDGHPTGTAVPVDAWTVTGAVRDAYGRLRVEPEQDTDGTASGSRFDVRQADAGVVDLVLVERDLANRTGQLVGPLWLPLRVERPGLLPAFPLRLHIEVERALAGPVSERDRDAEAADATILIALDAATLEAPALAIGGVYVSIGGVLVRMH